MASVDARIDHRRRGARSNGTAEIKTGGSNATEHRTINNSAAFNLAIYM
jgi:hypothetical protein